LAESRFLALPRSLQSLGTRFNHPLLYLKLLPGPRRCMKGRIKVADLSSFVTELACPTRPSIH
jgi:hypothetical protein